ncbi:hypothetical protein C0J52_24958 [Blattella germanica]|nr:hypothetical protein C0J52_24958 [Blattella germanica]
MFMYDSYVRTQSARAVRRLFHERFPDVQVPNRSTIQRLVNKYRETGIVDDKKQTQPRSVLTEVTLDIIRHEMETTPRKSLRCLSRETGISFSSIQRAIKILKMKPISSLTTGMYFNKLQNLLWMIGGYMMYVQKFFEVM